MKVMVISVLLFPFGLVHHLVSGYESHDRGDEVPQHRALKAMKKPNRGPAKDILPEVGIIDQCVAAYGDLQGAVVTQHQIPQGTIKETDTDCCKLCAENPLCDFWVRSADNANAHQQCLLKNAFTGYILETQGVSQSSITQRCCNPRPGVNCPVDKRCHPLISSNHPSKMRGNFMGQAYAGIIYINIPWNGGYAVQSILEHYSNRFGLRALRSTHCEDGSDDILNQSASCCRALMLSEYDYPSMIFPDGSPKSFQMLYQSTHYNPGALQMYLSPLSFSRKIVVFRHPMDVLEAIFFSATLQRKRVYSPSLEIKHDAQGEVVRSFENNWGRKRRKTRHRVLRSKSHREEAYGEVSIQNHNRSSFSQSVWRGDEVDGATKHPETSRRNLIGFLNSHPNSLVGEVSHPIPQSHPSSPFIGIGHKQKQKQPNKKVLSVEDISLLNFKSSDGDTDTGSVESASIYTSADSFSDDILCSSVAIDFTSWLEQCPLVNNGDYSILQFIDSDAHEFLKDALKTDPTIPPPVRGPLLKRAQERLQSDFTIGMSDKLDTSILLFEKVLGLSRADVLYSKLSMVQSPYEGPSDMLLNQFTPMREDWQGEEKKLDLINFLQLRGAPILYHMRLYEIARAVFDSQVARHLGTDKEIQALLATFHSQTRDFTKCYDNLMDLAPKGEASWKGQGKKFYQCPQELYTASSARKACTAEARSFDAKRMASERKKEASSNTYI